MVSMDFFWYYSLPAVLREPDISLLHFRQLLKTDLFNTDWALSMYLVLATARACATFFC